MKFNTWLRYFLLLWIFLLESANGEVQAVTQSIPLPLLAQDYDQLFHQGQAKEKYPLLDVFYQWGKVHRDTLVNNQTNNIDGSVNGSEGLSVKWGSVGKVIEAINLLHERHDEFADVVRVVLDYEIEKKGRLLKAIGENKKKEYLELCKIDIGDFTELSHILLNGDYQPSSYRNLALFLKYGQDDEKKKIFGGLYDLIVSSQNHNYSHQEIIGQIQKFETFALESARVKFESARTRQSMQKNLKIEKQQLQWLRKSLDLSRLEIDRELKNKSKEMGDLKNYSLRGNVMPFIGLSAIALADDIRKFEKDRQYPTYEESVLEEQNAQNAMAEKGVGCSPKNTQYPGFQVEVKEVENLEVSFTNVIRETLGKVNKVAKSEDFLKEVRNKGFSGVTAKRVVDFIKGSQYQLKVGGRNMGSRVNASAGVCADFIYFNTKKQFRHGADLAGTIFHEITHNLGFLHGSKVPYPLGDVMRKHYAALIAAENGEEENENPTDGEKDGDNFPYNFVMDGFFPDKPEELPKETNK